MVREASEHAYSRINETRSDSTKWAGSVAPCTPVYSITYQEPYPTILTDTLSVNCSSFPYEKKTVGKRPRRQQSHEGLWKPLILVPKEATRTRTADSGKNGKHMRYKRSVIKSSGVCLSAGTFHSDYSFSFPWAHAQQIFRTETRARWAFVCDTASEFMLLTMPHQCDSH